MTGLLMALPVTLLAQNPRVDWQLCLGGNNSEHATSIARASDGGYVSSGFTASNNILVSGNHGSFDFWVVKQEPSGTFEWQKTFGGTNAEEAYSMKRTADNGYVIAGYTSSNDGDVVGNHGALDCWIVKIDSAGNKEWANTIGGTGIDVAYDIVQTSQGDYLFCGVSSSSDGDVPGNAGGGDFLVVRLNSGGGIKWVQTFGGSGTEEAYSIIETNGGGILVAGYTTSNDGDVSGNNGARDFWILKLNPSGNFSWQRCQGGTGDDVAHSVMQDLDDRFLAAGYSESNDGDVGGNRGGRDYWMTCFDAPGIIAWERNFGGSGDEEASKLRQTLDGGFIMCGYTESTDGQVVGNHGLRDVWLVKTNLNGYVEWKKCFGGSFMEHISYPHVIDVQQDPDRSYILAATTTSNDGDVSNWIGGFDYWIAKLTVDCPWQPRNQATNNITASGAKLTWDQIPFAKNYMIRYRELGTSPWTTKYTNQNTSVKFISGLSPSTTYEWKVRARCQSGPNIYSRWSDKEQFTTTSLRLAGTGLPAGNFELGLYPNPTPGTIYITLDGPVLTGEERMTVEVLSMTGQALHHKDYRAAELIDGIEADLTFLERGVYMVRVSGERTLLNRTVVRH